MNNFGRKSLFGDPSPAPVGRGKRSREDEEEEKKRHHHQQQGQGVAFLGGDGDLATPLAGQPVAGGTGFEAASSSGKVGDTTTKKPTGRGGHSAFRGATARSQTVTVPPSQKTKQEKEHVAIDTNIAMTVRHALGAAGVSAPPAVLSRRGSTLGAGGVSATIPEPDTIFFFIKSHGIAPGSALIGGAPSLESPLGPMVEAVILDKIEKAVKMFLGIEQYTGGGRGASPSSLFGSAGVSPQKQQRNNNYQENDHVCTIGWRYIPNFEVISDTTTPLLDRRLAMLREKLVVSDKLRLERLAKYAREQQNQKGAGREKDGASEDKVAAPQEERQIEVAEIPLKFVTVFDSCLHDPLTREKYLQLKSDTLALDLGGSGDPAAAVDGLLVKRQTTIGGAVPLAPKIEASGGVPPPLSTSLAVSFIPSYWCLIGVSSSLLLINNSHPIVGGGADASSSGGPLVSQSGGVVVGGLTPLPGPGQGATSSTNASAAGGTKKVKGGTGSSSGKVTVGTKETWDSLGIWS